MKRFGKSKGFRRTGRRFGFKPKARFTNNTRFANATAMPRELYVPVPAQFHASLKLTLSELAPIDAGGGIYESQSTLTPWRTYLGADYYAEFLRPLMRIYSKGIVTKCVATYHIQNTGATPLELAAGVINNSSYVNLPAGPTGLDRLASFPEGKTVMVSGTGGGNDSRYISCSVDNMKFLNISLDHDMCFQSQQDGTQAASVLSGFANSPVAAFLIYNRSAVETAFIVRRTWIFHIKFFDRHAQSQTQMI